MCQSQSTYIWPFSAHECCYSSTLLHNNPVLHEWEVSFKACLLVFSRRGVKKRRYLPVYLHALMAAEEWEAGEREARQSQRVSHCFFRTEEETTWWEKGWGEEREVEKWRVCVSNILRLFVWCSRQTRRTRSWERESFFNIWRRSVLDFTAGKTKSSTCQSREIKG